MARHRTGAEDIPRLDDAELVRLVKNGQADAFAVLIGRYERQVYNLALRYSGDVTEAFDLAQEAFLRAHQALASFRGDARFSTWLYRIATNVCLDELRRRRNRPELTLDEPLLTSDGEAERQIADDSPGPEQRLEQSELAEVVQREIASLSEEYRAVIVLRDLQDLTYEEISDILGVSLGTVKSRLHRARALLRLRFEKLELFPPTIVDPSKDASGKDRGDTK